MIHLIANEVLRLHEKLLKATGGLPGIRDIGLLESAAYSALQSFGDTEAYPTAQEQAARLAYAITQSHPFLDGNKRTGILTMLMTLGLNGVNLKYTQEELIALGLSIADGTIQYEQILKWVMEHENFGAEGKGAPP